MVMIIQQKQANLQKMKVHGIKQIRFVGMEIKTLSWETINQVI